MRLERGYTTETFDFRDPTAQGWLCADLAELYCCTPHSGYPSCHLSISWFALVTLGVDQCGPLVQGFGDVVCVVLGGCAE